MSLKPTLHPSSSSINKFPTAPTITRTTKPIKSILKSPPSPSELPSFGIPKTQGSKELDLVRTVNRVSKIVKHQRTPNKLHLANINFKTFSSTNSIMKTDRKFKNFKETVKEEMAITPKGNRNIKLRRNTLTTAELTSGIALPYPNKEYKWTSKELEPEVIDNAK